MKIWGNIPKVSGVYGNSGKIEKSSRVGEVASKKDELTISGTAKDFSVVMKALRGVPDVRQDKVAEVSKKVDQGSYQVASGDVASKIVDMLQNKKV
jgi:negative regulator of flagellin synthesis FlgM